MELRRPGSTVGDALYGLQRISSDHSQVWVIVSGLASHVAGCKETLSGQAVGNALYGLQCMSSDHSVVIDVLSALASDSTKHTTHQAPLTDRCSCPAARSAHCLPPDR